MLKTTAIASALMLVATSIGCAQGLEITTRGAIDNTEATCLLVQVSTGTPPSAVAEQHREDREFTQDAKAATGTSGEVANVSESLAFREDIASFKLVLLEELKLLKEEVSAINEDDPEQFYECLGGSAGKRGLMARHLFFPQVIRTYAHTTA
jgi:hypothetical protein